jgi:hypothetical protein
MEWRTGKQCRERYINQLDPNIKKTPWTAEEDAVIVRLHEQLGKKWSKFMDYLPGRSDNAIKNRWHVISKDNCVDQSQSCYQAFQQVQRTNATKNEAKTKLAISHQKAHRKNSAAKRSNESIREVHEPAMPTVKEETLDSLCGELMVLEGDCMDFDICSFSEENEMDDEDEEGSSSTVSPRTTNDLNDSAGEESYAQALEYTYSKSSSEGMCSRESPVDPAMMAENTAVAARMQLPALQTMSAALPVTPSESSNAGSQCQSSPTAVCAVASPRSKLNSPKTTLNIQTNNSLYDFDCCFPQGPTDGAAQASGSAVAGIDTSAVGLQSRSDDSVRILQEAVCWQYDPNEDLAQALEFLMSATASPAGTASVGNAFSSGSGSFRAPRSHQGSLSAAGNRSPNSSLFNLLDNGSPNTSQRMRPFSGNLASTASLLARASSNASTSNSRLNCDPEFAAATSAPSATAYNSRPLPAQPPSQTAPAPAAAQQRFSGGLSSGIGMPEHSPMNHTHFSPACPNSKRPRGKNPCHFNW